MSRYTISTMPNIHTFTADTLNGLVKCGLNVTNPVTAHYHLDTEDVRRCYMLAHDLNSPSQPPLYPATYVSALRQANPRPTTPANPLYDTPNSTPNASNPFTRPNPNPNPRPNPAPKQPRLEPTVKQVSYYTSLVNDANEPNRIKNLDRREVSAEIDRLRAKVQEMRKQQRTQHTTPTAPRQPRNVTRLHDITEGMYILNNVVFRVQVAVHGSGQLYAKKFNPVTKKFVRDYEGMRKLRTSPGTKKMDTADAHAFGTLYGVCCSCSRTLTDADSIFNGFGKICAGNHGWTYRTAPMPNSTPAETPTSTSPLTPTTIPAPPASAATDPTTHHIEVIRTNLATI